MGVLRKGRSHHKVGFFFFLVLKSTIEISSLLESTLELDIDPVQLNEKSGYCARKLLRDLKKFPPFSLTLELVVTSFLQTSGK